MKKPRTPQCLTHVFRILEQPQRRVYKAVEEEQFRRGFIRVMDVGTNNQAWLPECQNTLILESEYLKRPQT